MARSGIRPHESEKMWLEVAFDLIRVVQSGPGCKMCKDYYYLLNTGEVTTEPHESPKYQHESFKVHVWTTWAQVLGVKRDQDREELLVLLREN